jgi:hypothetical protein
VVVEEEEHQHNLVQQEVLAEVVVMHLVEVLEILHL